nr:uncharacterized protein LOC115264860 [Aedes albopictus]
MNNNDTDDNNSCSKLKWKPRKHFANSFNNYYYYYSIIIIDVVGDTKSGVKLSRSSYSVRAGCSYSVCIGTIRCGIFGLRKIQQVARMFVGKSLSISKPPTEPPTCAYDDRMEKKTDPVETTEGIVVPMGPVGDAGSNGGGDRMNMCRSGGMAIRDPKDALHNIEEEGELMNGTSSDSEAGKKCIASGRIMSPEAWNYRPDKDASE